MRHTRTHRPLFRIRFLGAILVVATLAVTGTAANEQIHPPLPRRFVDLREVIPNAGVDLLNKDKKAVRTWTFNTDKALNRFEWDFLIVKKHRKKLPAGRRPFVLPGVYTLRLTTPEGTHSIQIEIKKPDEPKPWWAQTTPR